MKQLYYFSCTVALILLMAVSATAQVSKQKDGSAGKVNLLNENKKDSFYPVYVQKDEVYLEIPTRLQNRDFVIGARVAAISSTSNRTKLVAGQMFYNPVMFRFVIEDNQVLLLKPNVDLVCSTDDLLYPAFEKNNITPIQQVFDVDSRTDTSVVINITKFILEDLPYVEPLGDKMKPGKTIAKATKLLDSKTYPRNIEFQVRYAFEGTKEPFAAVIQKSLMLLDEKPMMARLTDDRLSYKEESKKIYSINQQGIQRVGYVRRFNLQPKGGILPKKGQQVEPEKPIVFYVDSAFPEVWRQAIKLGVEDWQKAFEAIGFRNAIVAKDYPKNDPNFDPNDMRFNCIKFATSEFENAMGQHFIDPRSGEIINAEVLFYSSVTSRLHKWYFLQTAAVNPDARKPLLSDDTMVRLIRYLVAHEVGHCLGMEHNFRGSYAYATEDLRSKKFTEQHGTTASIMDYARFNYVAQPRDKGVNLFPPLIGVYDYHAIKLAYQPIPDAKTPFEEQATLRKWLLENETNPMYMYGKRTGGGTRLGADPSRQSADLGNDLVASSTYGINNLKYILEHLKEWMQQPDDSYNYIAELYQDIQKENFAYISKTIPLIAGVYDYQPVANGKLPLYELVSKKESVKAIEFICAQLLSQHEWLDNSYVRSFAGSQVDKLAKSQQGIIESLLDSKNGDIFKNMYLYEGNKNFITAQEYLRELTKHFFATEAKSIYHRNIQQFYISKLKSLAVTPADSSGSFFDASLAHVAEMELTNIAAKLAAQQSDWNSFLLKKHL